MNALAKSGDASVLKYYSTGTACTLVVLIWPSPHYDACCVHDAGHVFCRSPDNDVIGIFQRVIVFHNSILILNFITMECTSGFSAFEWWSKKSSTFCAGER